MATSSFDYPIVIIGGGLVGLTLAQALRKATIPCTVYERDDALETEKGGGWAITVHWALKNLEDCLTQDIFERLTDIQVDPEQGLKDTGRFLFLNLATAQPKYEIPPTKRLRVNRRLLRLLLAEGINVQYGRHIAQLDVQSANRPATVTFEDGTSISSKLIIGCDGSNSRMRHILFSAENNPSKAALHRLPVRSMGVTIRMSEQQVIPLRQIDPLLFQGCHPDTGVFLWYSIVSTPALNGSGATGEPFYEGQLIMSWVHRSSEHYVPSDNKDRRQMMRRMAQPFHDVLRTAVESITADALIKEISLADWPTLPWPNFDGRVVLCGDAAHAMTMYRGEAFNHGVTDAANLAKLLVQVRDGEKELEGAIEEYEREVIERTHEAVLLSRQACLDAHDLHHLGPNSPLVSKRARILAPAKAVSAVDVDM